MKMILIFFHSLVMLGILNCSSAPSYLSDRGMDARDVVEVGIQTGSFGFAIEFGPYLIGPLYLDVLGFGLSSGEFHNSGSTTCLLFYCENGGNTSLSENINIIERLDYRKKEYCISQGWDSIKYRVECLQFSEPKTQSYGKIGLRMGFLAGARFSFNFIEAIDFMTGIFGFDLLKDDFYKFKNNKASVVYAIKK